MRLKNYTLLLVAATALASAQDNSYEGETLPTMNAVDCKDSVKIPNHPLDAGFLTDRDCSTIFVYPPKYGKFEVTQVSPNSTMQSCPSVNATFDLMNALKLERLDIQKSREAARASGDVDTHKMHTEFMKSNNSLIAETTVEMSSAPVEGLSAQVFLESDWNAVVKAYKDINGENINVQPLNVIGAYLSAAVVMSEELDRSNDERLFRALLDARVPGLNPVPKFYEFSSANSRDQISAYQSSTNGTITLSLTGSCPFYDSTTNIINPNPSPGVGMSPHLAANVTYFYEVEVPSGYSVSMNVDLIKDIFKKHYRRDGTISSESIIRDVLRVSGSEAIKIEIHNSRVQSYDANLIRNRVVESFVNKLLTSIAEPAGSIPEPIQVKMPEDPHVVVNGVQRVCEKKFWMRIYTGKECHDVAYRTRQTVDAWTNSVVDYLRRYNLNSSEDFVQYDTVVVSGAFGFKDFEYIKSSSNQ
jgi:hypothetical protein